ncbi:MAG: DUF6328 family protein [Candidatus Micrarchaeia archaeon]
MARSEGIHDIARQLSDVLAELRTLLTVSGVIFGFLLSASAYHAAFPPIKDQLFVISIISSILAIGIFSIPVIYHHVQFPYPSREKFIARSHQFITLGFIPLIIMFFATTTFALFDFFGYSAFLISLVLLMVFVLIYASRKIIFHL